MRPAARFPATFLGFLAGLITAKCENYRDPDDQSRRSVAFKKKIILVALGWPIVMKYVTRDVTNMAPSFVGMLRQVWVLSLVFDLAFSV